MAYYRAGKIDYSASPEGVSLNLLSGAPGKGGYAEGDLFKDQSSAVEIIGSAFNDILVGVANKQDDILRGGAGNDKLIGASGFDKLYGGDGKDRLIGDIGGDELWGGAGQDTFIYRKIHDSAVADYTAPDTIMDFQKADKDRIDLSALDANSSLAGDQAFTWLGLKAYTNTPGELRYDVLPDGRVSLVGDINGNGLNDIRIYLDHIDKMYEGYFVL